MYDLFTIVSRGLEPSLLPWLARNAATSDWPQVMLAAARFGGLEPGEAWPAIGMAVDEIAIARGLTRPTLPALPARPGVMLHNPATLFEEEVAWLLPQIPAGQVAGLPRIALGEIEQALLSGRDWYAALLISHLAPVLGSLRERVRSLAVRHGNDYWRAYLIALAALETPADSAAAEVDRSHPAVPALDRLAQGLPADQLEPLCRQLLAVLLDPDSRTAVARELRATKSSSLERFTPVEPLDAREGPALWVNNGIADPLTRRPHSPHQSLSTDTAYLFWFEIGDAPDPLSAEREPAELELPDDVTAGAVLQVTLTGGPGDLVVETGRETGELIVGADGRVRVARQPDGSASGGSRLYFPIRAPAGTGRRQLRCSLLHKGRNLQSRVVTTMVDEAEQVRAWAVETTVDFLSGQSLGAEALAAMEPIDLSILVDDRRPPGDLTGLVVAQGVEVAAVSMPVDALQQQVERARYALRRVSHNDVKLPQPGQFRYDDYDGAPKADPEAFRRDLELLALRGSDAWVELGGHIAMTFEQTGRAHLLSEPGPPGYEKVAVWRLSAWLRRPRVIEMANTADLRILIPATMIYDRPLAFRAKFRICDTFLNAQAGPAELSAVECFRGNCPHWDDDTVICPSGFWGFRHLLGSPQSVGQIAGADASRDVSARGPSITHSGRPRCAVGRAADFGREHPHWVSGLGDGSLPVRTDAASLLDDLRRDPEPHLVYFYCHGDFSDGMPVLQFDEAGDDVLAATDVAGRVRWLESQPLVFLNACRSIATQPEHASSFIEALIRRAGASGMVGTEIITYERLAADFAEQVLTEFVERRRPIGEAMRTARLRLLTRGNPLGLIYTAYAPPHLTMRSVA
ncbi:CHAT domain-containing protein [Paractinoplanes brasiliensis]|uniref:CHAT domain-containing protein n=1 Tax=Paractinoplanes brasiliensis TaxID=52695 RepID=A0A4R6JWY9_9ACTN|nr:CHAT domain-containing protein [Actinoplanes brasiliensis]TDO41294.1 CHAT domain-containing protein [Actinoplanes brasiliensis]GID27423.1 hypothetical protein Abr02nite_24060 [Actinoplanes brasiliensis]